MSGAVDDETIAAARKGNRDAIVALLSAHYAVVWRMGVGLTGRQSVGKNVVQSVMQRSLRSLQKFADLPAASRWFHHHTVLTSRRAGDRVPEPSSDSFLRGQSEITPAYRAFIAALRRLPYQQREAFILTYGEELGSRALAVAMDCSTMAAENHLREASNRLIELSGADFDSSVRRLKTAYRFLTPEEQLALKHAQDDVRRLILPWVIKRLGRFAVAILLLVLIIWGSWWIYRIVRNSAEAFDGSKRIPEQVQSSWRGFTT